MFMHLDICDCGRFMVHNSCRSSPFLTSPVSSVGEYSLMGLNKKKKKSLSFPSVEMQSFPHLRIAISVPSAGLISHLLPLIIVDLVPPCGIAGAQVGAFTCLVGDKLD